eukprot:TRINITY_DN2830_c0_g1_i7.p2 TRINITY_DN2830_c0_g1~~TRINITY_DN2830_c0_g1_i7.p2  ORF type:complete len:132 (+),score=27.47 TRINITY_DN2830_c0_g1_i7:77-472(+)
MCIRDRYQRRVHGNNNMGKCQRRRNNTARNKQYRKARGTKRRIKDIDQIIEDMKEPEKFANQEKDDELPGQGQYYCLHCARYFISMKAIKTHLASKQHKKRLKRTKEKPYTQEEADLAGGLGRVPISTKMQ